MSTKLKWFGNQVVAAVNKAALEGLISAGEHLRAESTSEVPIDTHILQESCEVSNDGKSRVNVSYDTVYAVPQHERLDFNHPNGGNAKYLENPLNREKETMLDIVAQTIRGELG